MRNLLVTATVLLVTLFGLAGIPACAGRMQETKGTMMEKDRTMAKDGSMTETDKGMVKSDKEMMGQKERSMMEQKTALMEGKMAATRTGMLAGAGSHHATGKASVTKDQSGHVILTLAEIRVDKVPDGRVYLAKNGNHRTGIELGKLTQFSGTVTFQIPGTVHPEDYDSVVIWCKKFNVEIGRAFFDKAMMEANEAMMEKTEAMMEGDKGMTQ